MTIAAGFNYPNGVMLCADTKHTSHAKLQSSKIFYKTYDSGGIRKAASAIAYAGNMRYSRMAIYEIEQEISSMSAPSIDVMVRKIKGIVKKLHEDHLYKHPDRATGNYSVSLLMALWTEADGCAKLFTTEDTSVMFSPGYDCMGSGWYLGHYLIRPRYSPQMSLAEIILVAIGALTSIKAYDDQCGGRSDIVVLNSKGEIRESRSFDISTREKLSEGFDSASKNLLFELSKATSQTEIRLKLQDFCEEIEEMMNDLIRDKSAVKTLLDYFLGL